LLCVCICNAFVASGTAYDSLSEVCPNDDNGCTSDGWRLNKAFTAAVPYSAVICGTDFNKYKYHNVTVTYNGNKYSFQVWDCCSDSDCNGCCSENARKNGGFLLDMSIMALKRYGMESKDCDNWGVKRIDVLFTTSFDPQYAARAYGITHDC